MTRISARLTNPIAAAAATASPDVTPSTNARVSSISPFSSVENPSSFGSCPMRIVSASPFMYPICVGLERRSAMNPSFPIPATIVMTPTSRASIDANATARSGSPPDPMIGRIVAAIIGPSEESGPSTRTREGPNAA